jgi:hypothetical protein
MDPTPPQSPRPHQSPNSPSSNTVLLAYSPSNGKRLRDIQTPPHSPQRSPSDGTQLPRPLNSKRRLDFSISNSFLLTSRTVEQAQPPLVIPEVAKAMHAHLLRLQQQYISFGPLAPSTSELLDNLKPLASFISSLQEDSLEKPTLALFLSGYLALVQEHFVPEAVTQLPLHLPFIQDILLTERMTLKCDRLSEYLAPHIIDPQRQTRLFDELPTLRSSTDIPTILIKILPNLTTTPVQVRYIKEVYNHCDQSMRHHILRDFMQRENLAPEVCYTLFQSCYGRLFINDHSHFDVIEYLSVARIKNLLDYNHELTNQVEVTLFYKNISCFAKFTKKAQSFPSLRDIYYNLITHPNLSPEKRYYIGVDIFTSEDFRVILHETAAHKSIIDNCMILASLPAFKSLFSENEHSVLFDQICNTLSSFLDLDEDIHSYAIHILNFIKIYWTEKNSKAYWNLIFKLLESISDIRGVMYSLISFVDNKLSNQPNKEKRLLQIANCVFSPFLTEGLLEYQQMTLTTLAVAPSLSLEARCALLDRWAMYASKCPHNLYRKFFLTIVKTEFQFYCAKLVYRIVPHLTEISLLKSAFNLVQSSTSTSFMKMQALTAIAKHSSDRNLFQRIYDFSLKLIKEVQYPLTESDHTIVFNLCTCLRTTISGLLNTCTNEPQKNDLETMSRTINTLTPYRSKSGFL